MTITYSGQQLVIHGTKAEIEALAGAEGLAPDTGAFSDDTLQKGYYDGSSWVWMVPGSGGTLASLSDVVITSPSADQVLKYNSGTGKWNNTAVPAHSASHKDGGSDEVATGTPAAYAIPKADAGGTLGSWITGGGGGSIPVAPANLYVALTGSDTNDGLTTGTPLATFQAAIDKVPDLFDRSVTIHIASGFWLITGDVECSKIKNKHPLNPGDRLLIRGYFNATAHQFSMSPEKSGTFTATGNNFFPDGDSTATDSGAAFGSGDSLRTHYLHITGGPSYNADNAELNWYVIAGNDSTTYGTDGIWAGRSTLAAQGCIFESYTRSGIYATQGSAVMIRSSLARMSTLASGFKGAVILDNNSTGVFMLALFDTGYMGLNANANSNAYFAGLNVLKNCTIALLSMILSYIEFENSYTHVSNNGTGVYASRGGVAQTSMGSFSGNSVNTGTDTGGQIF
jgi:hypothetical protein